MEAKEEFVEGESADSVVPQDVPNSAEPVAALAFPAVCRLHDCQQLVGEVLACACLRFDLSDLLALLGGKWAAFIPGRYLEV